MTQHKDLTGDLPPIINTTSVIGRQSDLDRLRTALADTSQVALVNGLGGIGKSTLAKLYIAENYQHFDHIAWLSFTGKSFEDMVTSSLLAESLGLDRKTIASDKLLPLIFQKLKDLEGNNLLVIDNADHTEEVSKYRNRLPQGLGNWQVLITSRGVIEGFEQIPIDMLSPTDAKTLFLTHCPHAKSETEALEELLNLVGLHTLTIELMAKTLAKSRRLKSVADLLVKIKDKKYEDSALLEEVWVEHKDKWAIGSNEEENRRIKGVYQYLLAVFDIADLDRNKLWILKKIALFSPISINTDALLRWQNLTETRQQEVDDDIDWLVNHGWIEEFKNQGFIKVHPVLKDVIDAVTPLSFNDSLSSLYGIAEKIEIKKSNTMTELISKFKWLGYGETLFKHIEWTQKREKESIIKPYPHQETKLIVLHVFFSRFSRLHQISGNFNNALLYVNRALDITKDISDINKRHHLAGDSYNLTASILIKLGKSREAGDYLLKSVNELSQIENADIEIFTPIFNFAEIYTQRGEYKEAEKILDLALDIHQEGSVDFAKYMLNKAVLYTKTGKIKDALSLARDALHILNKKPDRNDLILAQAKNLTAAIYNANKLFSDAIPLLEEVVNFYTKNYGDTNSMVSSSYTNLANAYDGLDKKEKAIAYYEKSLRIGILHLDKTTVAMATRYGNLGFAYFEVGKLKEGREYLEKSLHIHQKLKNEYLDSHRQIKIIEKKLKISSS
jgi:tetratricopeptide (TPR) repeat protein